MRVGLRPRVGALHHVVAAETSPRGEILESRVALDDRVVHGRVYRLALGVLAPKRLYICKRLPSALKALHSIRTSEAETAFGEALNEVGLKLSATRNKKVKECAA
eukprot:6209573-Pleurochrysis_carterae.AAC.2